MMKVEHNDSYSDLLIKQTQQESRQTIQRTEQANTLKVTAEPEKSVTPASETEQTDNQQETGTNRDELAAVLEQVNQYADFREVNLHLRIDEDTDMTVVSVVDKETDEVIRQIPSEEALKLAKSIQDAMQEFLEPSTEDKNFHFLSDQA